MFYLFDGYNLLHAAGLRSREELVDKLAGFVAVHGARGVVVFDGVGEDATVGALEVRHAQPADHLIERLAAESRDRERVILVSSDRLIRETVGQEVGKRASASFAAELDADPPSPQRSEGSRATRVEDSLDPETRERLERWRRGRS